MIFKFTEDMYLIEDEKEIEEFYKAKDKYELMQFYQKNYNKNDKKYLVADVEKMLDIEQISIIEQLQDISIYDFYNRYNDRIKDIIKHDNNLRIYTKIINKDGENIYEGFLQNKNANEICIIDKHNNEINIKLSEELSLVVIGVNKVVNEDELFITFQQYEQIIKNNECIHGYKHCITTTEPRKTCSVIYKDDKFIYYQRGTRGEMKEINKEEYINKKIANIRVNNSNYN